MNAAFGFRALFFALFLAVFFFTVLAMWSPEKVNGRSHAR
jgi:hypothetical protein